MGIHKQATFKEGRRDDNSTLPQAWIWTIGRQKDFEIFMFRHQVIPACIIRGAMSADGSYTITSELSFRLAGHLVRDEFHNLHLKSKGICKSGLCLGNDIGAEASALLTRLLQACERSGPLQIKFCSLQQTHMLTVPVQQAQGGRGMSKPGSITACTAE